jgi:drug/metabolite transporter (DMT)-like permease
MSPIAKAQWQLHFCVVLWGFTAILGKLISLSAIALVWWRMLLVTGILLLLPQVWRGMRALSKKLIAAYAGVGVLIALHWLTFYSAVKLANASVAATCIALGTVFLALIEPWIARRRFDPRELLFGVATVPGVALVVGGIPSQMRLGVAVGVVSALLVAFFGALNKRLVEHADPLVVTTIEIGAGVVFLTVLAPLLPVMGSPFVLPDRQDAILLLMLALFCTLLPFALSLVSLRHLSAFTTQLAVNLEPVYAIVLAIFMLGEQHELGRAFYAGVAIILASVFVHPLLERRPDHNETSDTQGIAQ